MPRNRPGLRVLGILEKQARQEDSCSVPSMTVDCSKSVEGIGIGLPSTFSHHIWGPELPERRKTEPVPGLISAKVLLESHEVKEACLGDHRTDVGRGLFDKGLNGAVGLEPAPWRRPNGLVAQVDSSPRLFVVSRLSEGVLSDRSRGLYRWSGVVFSSRPADLLVDSNVDCGPSDPIRPTSREDMRRCSRPLRRCPSTFGDDRLEFNLEGPPLEQRAALRTRRVFGLHASHREGRVEPSACRLLEFGASHDKARGPRTDRNSGRFAEEFLTDAGQNQTSTCFSGTVTGMPECQV
mmetsp:Transcript_509/g.1466  ORF Transcript_509/g.1466 Transcript_509/m.1466 type:complete len:294 (+) Transcript_509:254-1135(+)